jgi:hypothetical protein
MGISLNIRRCALTRAFSSRDGEHLSRFWRAALVSAGAVAVVASGVGPAVAQTATGPTVTITAKASSVYGYTFVGFKDGKYSKVAFTGNISGATSGMAAQLYAQPFPYKKAPAPVAGQKLALDGTSSQGYSFTATPGIATRYSVEILPSSTVSTPVQATSATRTVYVVTIQPVTGWKTCNPPRRGQRPICHQSLHIYTRLPASAYKAESKKTVYFYLAVRLSPTAIPRPPTTLSLLRSAKISKAKRISATEFEQTVTFSFFVSDHDAYNANIDFCSKASESSDGVNLPGHHHCGAKKVKTSWFLG